MYVCVYVSREKNTHTRVRGMYVFRGKSTIFPVSSVDARSDKRGEGVQGSWTKKRLSGIIRRCRAVYRAFALRSLIRVLYIYSKLTRRRPGRFVFCPPLRLSFPLGARPPHSMFSHPVQSVGERRGSTRMGVFPVVRVHRTTLQHSTTTATVYHPPTHPLHISLTSTLVVVLSTICVCIPRIYTLQGGTRDFKRASSPQSPLSEYDR